MKHQAKILADSVSPDGARLVTFELTYPRIIHAEMMTHRVFSRNAASSRAIPVEKMIRLVQEAPYIPSSWGQNQKGMQAGEDLSPVAIEQARTEWLKARDLAVVQAQKLLDLGLHKQLTNRLLEPFQWYTALFTGTEWSNFFHLRCHPAAHPDIRMLAEEMRAGFEASTPTPIGYNEWHLPLIFEEDLAAYSGMAPKERWEMLCKISIGRCARVSYLTHDGKRDHAKDLELYERLFDGGHMSPFEHVATPLQGFQVDELNEESKFEEGQTQRVKSKFASSNPRESFVGNFKGWVQFRKTIPYEEDLLGAR